ncbi:MerR family transcriptional regulator [Corynebacterium cystitidis]|uniref:MerR family transcriptional regulator n=1 Tax=Corynebacterium cystitidis TaxID=35757 RepID=UPI00211E04F4|nr:MerR family transcriptional regulator [Corynebacterium cystitidis]
MITISEAAEALGVTPKALRHWDSLGLLTPSGRTWSGYRLYSEADLQRGALIVLYRSTGMSLASIKELVDATAPTIHQALAAHRAELLRRQESLHEQLTMVDHLLDTYKKGEDLMKDLISYFGEHMPAYQQEAEQNWGDTPEWEQAEEAVGTADFEAIQKEQQELAAALATARDNGVQPGSQEAFELVEQHRASISRWYDCPRERQWLLTEMYVTDSRFDEAFAGTQHYLLELVEAQARAEGVEGPRW